MERVRFGGLLQFESDALEHFLHGAVLKENRRCNSLKFFIAREAHQLAYDFRANAALLEVVAHDNRQLGFFAGVRFYKPSNPHNVPLAARNRRSSSFACR